MKNFLPLLTSLVLLLGASTITKANGLNTFSSVGINLPPSSLVINLNSIVNNNCNGGNTGQILITVTGGTPGYSYLWSNSSTVEDQSNLTAGIYFVTVTDANLATATASYTITQPSEIVLDASYSDLLCFGETDGSIDLIPSGGTGAFTYSWSNGATTQDISGLTSATYSVSVTDANGCTATKSFVINQPTQIFIQSNISNVSCFGFGNGAIDISVTGGTGSYTYFWNDFSIDEDKSGLTPGTYTISVTDANNCTKTASFTITEPNDLVVSGNINQLNCNGDTNGSIDILAEGGTAPYSYAWSTGSSNEDINNLSAGTYSVTVTDSKGCNVSMVYTVTQPSAIINNPVFTNVLCFGGGAVIDNVVTGGASPYSYFWSDFNTEEDRSGLTPGTYTVLITDANGCTTSSSFLVTEPNDLIVSAVYNNLYCFGDINGSIDLTVEDGTSPYSYNWSNGATTEDISGLAAGTYVVTVTDANGCVVNGTYIINQPPQLVNTPVFSNILCYGNLASIDNIITGGTPPYSYFWSDFSTDEDKTDLIVGTYLVTVTDANNCTISSSFVVTQPDELLISAVYNNLLCFGNTNGDIDLTIEGGVLPYNVLWSNGATTEDLSGLVANTYTVTVSDASGCVVSNSYTITQPPLLQLSSVFNNITCNGGTASVDNTVTGGTPPYTFFWSDFDSNEDKSGMTAGTYTLLITDDNECTITTSFTVVEPTDLVVSAVYDNLLCNGDSNGFINLLVEGGVGPYSYNWSNGATTEDVSGLIAGTYSVTVTDSIGCVKTFSYTISQPTLLTLNSVVSNVSCYNNGNASINNTTTGGVAPYVYFWSDFSTDEDRSGLSPGIYTVTVTDANSCTKTASFNITQPDELVISAVYDNLNCFGDNNGYINLTVDGGTSPFTFNWSNGSTSEDLIGLVSGTYTVSVSDANGCGATFSYTINQPTQILLNPVVTNVSCFGLGNASINLNVTGGVAPYIYFWSDFDTNEDKAGLSPGIYTVSVTDANNCTVTSSFTITEPNDLIASAVYDNLLCFGDNNGYIDLTVEGGTAPYTYNWSTGATTEDISGLVAGTYTVILSDINGCSITYSYTINQPTQLAMTATTVNVLCHGFATGEINLTVSGGTAPYSYFWSDFNTNEDRTGLLAGPYSVTITDANNCTLTATFLITEPLALSISETHVNVVCYNGSTGAINITSSNGTLPYSYQWDDGTTNEDRNNLTAGQYTVTVTDSCGATQSISVTITEGTEILISSTITNLFCHGDGNGQIDISVVGGNSPYTYLWSNGMTTEDIFGLSGGTYTITVTDNTGCAKSAIYVLNEPSAIALTSNITNVNCNGENNGEINITVSGGTVPYTFLWEDFSTDEDRTSLVAGTYTVLVTDFNNCTLTASFTVNQPTQLVASGTQVNILCHGFATGSIDVTVTGGTLPYSYNWSNGSTSQDLNNLIAGTYTVSIADAHNCTQVLTFTITEPPALLATETHANISCFGGNTGSINVTVTGGTLPYSYIWDDFTTTEDRSNLTASQYTVTVTDSCGAVQTLNITISQSDEIFITNVITDLLCHGDGNGIVDITVVGGNSPFSYAWSNGATTEDLAGLSGGTYTVVVTDITGCSKTLVNNVFEPTALALTSNITNVNCNSENNGAIDITVTGGTAPYTYFWNDFTTDEDRSSMVAGTYTVLVTDFNNCTITSSFTITQPTQLVASGTQVNILCHGFATGSIDVTVTGGTLPYSYNWSNGSTSQDLNNLIAGTYTVSIADAHNCTQVLMFTITEPAALLATETHANISCFGGNSGSIDVTVTGGTLPYSIIWDDGTTTEDRSNLTASQYTVTVTDSCGAVQTLNITISQSDEIFITNVITDLQCHGEGNGSIDITIVGGNPPFSYAWSNGATTEDLAGLSGGTYTVVVTDITGCSKTLVNSVFEPTALALTSNITNVNCNGENNGAIDITVTGGTAPYTYFWNDFTTDEDRSSMLAGTYTVFVTDFNNCTLTASFTVNQPTQLVASGTQVNILCHGFATGSIDVTVTGGTLPYSYNWSNGSTSQDLNNLIAGTYTVSIADAHNCTQVLTFTITEPPALLATETHANISCFGGNTGSINVTVTGGTLPYSYIWDDFTTTEDRSNLTASQYTVTVTDSCGAVQTLNITISQSDEIFITNVITDLQCHGEGNGSIDITIVGGNPPFSYAWSNGATTEDLAGLSGGTYTVVVTDITGCSKTLVNSVFEPTALALTSNITNVNCNGENNGAIDITVTGGTAPYTYFWNDFTTDEDRSSMVAGTYTVTVTDFHNCTITSSFTITQPTQLVASGTQVNILCHGFATGSIDVTVTGGTLPYSYNWSNGSTSQDLNNLIAGTYTVSISDAHNCTQVLTFNITEPAALLATETHTNISCFGGNTGSIDVTVTGGTLPYTYIWDDLTTTEDRSNLTASQYTITVTDSCGAVQTLHITISQSDEIFITSVITDLQCNGEGNGSIDITVVGGNPPFSYLWSNGATTEDLTGLSGGTYTVVATDLTGCSKTEVYTVLEPTLMELTSNITNVNCNSESNGAIDITVTGGTAPYTYFWNDFTTDEDRSSMLAGTYTVTVTDFHNCTITSSFTITQPTQLVASGTQVNILCHGFATGSIDVTVTGGTLPYSYNWSNGSTSQDLNNLIAGTYTVSISDAHNCTQVLTFNITEPAALLATETHTNISCFGGNTGSIDVTVTGGTLPYTYIWDDLTTTEDRSNLTASQYTITVTDSCGAVQTLHITISQSDEIFITSVITDLQCNGEGNGSIDITVVGGNPPFSYLWSNGATTEDLTGLSGGTYTVVATDLTGCSKTEVYTVLEPTLMELTSNITNVNCNSESNGAIDITVTGGTAPYTYFWNDFTTDEDRSSMLAGTYTVTVTDFHNCTITSSFTITQPTQLVASGTQVNILCHGFATGSIDVTVTGGTLPYSYNWSNGSTSQDLNNLIAGTYTVSIADAHNCTQVLTFNITEPAALLATETHANISCFGGNTGSIDVTVTGGTLPYSFIWDDFTTTEDRSNLTAGQYAVTVTDSCGAVQTLQINITESEEIFLTSVITDLQCHGDANGEIDITVVGGNPPFSYAWSNGATTEDLTGLSGGTYTVVATDITGCSKTLVTVVVEPTLMVLTSNITNVNCNSENNGAIDITVTGGTPPYAYFWDDFTTDEDRSSMIAGTYTVTVTDFHNCTITSSFTITQPTQLVASGTQVNILCHGFATGSIDVTVTGGTLPYSYNWSNGATSQDLNNLIAGTYTVSIADAHNCTQVLTFNITEPAALLATETHANISCFGGNTGSIDVTVTGGTLPYSFIWDDFTTTEDRSNLTASQYTVTVTDSCGAVQTLTITISESDEIFITSVKTDLQCHGDANGEIDITVVGGNPPFSYAWSNGATTEDLVGLSGGTYTVVATDLTGCSKTEVYNIFEPTALVLTSNVINVNCNGESNGDIDITVSGGTAPYTYFWDDFTTDEDRSSMVAGTYTVTVTDFHNCTITSSFTISQPTQLVATGTQVNILCHGFASGSIDVTVTGGTLPYAYSWSNGESTEDLNNIIAGTYTVLVTDAHNCTQELTFTITEPPALLATETHTNISCFGGNSGSIDVTVTGGTLPYTYNWDDGTTTEDRTNLTAGVYTITITCSCGAVQTLTITISESDEIFITSVKTDLQCNGDANGSIDITTVGGNPPFTYAWSNGATAEDLSGLSGGTYTVVATDLTGCSKTEVYTVLEPTALVLTSNVINVNCNGESNGDIDITVSGGTAPYTYFWDDFTTDEDRSSMVAGTYTVTVTDFHNCTITSSFTISQPTQLVATGTQVNILCHGFASGSIDVTVTGGTLPYAYSWSNGESTEDLNNIIAGTYTVLVTDAHSCTQELTFTITEPAALLATETQANISCFGGSTGSINVTVTGGTLPYNYNWDDGTTTEDRSNLTAGEYTITVTDSCAAVQTLTITITESDEIFITSIKTDLQCNGDANGSIDITTVGGNPPFTYAWSNGATTEDLAGLSGGTYTVVATDITGCSKTEVYTVLEPTPMVLTSVINNVICFGYNSGGIDITVTGGTPPYEYFWSDFSTDEDRTTLVTGTYTVTVTDFHNCTTTASFEVIQNPEMNISASIVNVSCFGQADGNVTLTVTGGVPGYTYQWDNGETGQTAFLLNAGLHCVTVTDSVGCDTIVCYTITEPQLLEASFSTVDVLCFGNSTGSATVFPTGGTAPYSYSWNSIPVQTTATATGLPADIYTCTITDAHGCERDVVIQILQPDSFYNTIVVTNIVCGGDSTGAISIATSGGTAPYSYLWSNGNTNASLVDLIAGTYTLTVTDSNNCQITDVIVVSESPVITINLNVTNVQCYGFNNGQIVATVTGGTGNLTYLWNTNPAQSTNTASALFAGTYSLLVTDINGCTKSASATVTQPDTLALNAVVTNVNCFGENNGSVILNITGGTFDYNIVWSNGNSTQSNTGLVAGSYTVTVTDNHNCITTETFIITQPDLLTITPTVTNISCFGDANGSITLAVTGGTLPYSYLWNNGNTNSSLSGLNPGTYTVVVTDAHNCSSTATVNITQPNVLTATTSVVNVSCFGLSNGSATALPSGGTVAYSYSWRRLLPAVSGVLATTQTLSGVTPGTYEVTVTDAHGCSVTATAIITQPAALAISSSIINVSCNGGSNGQITVTVTGGTQPYQYLWSTIPPQTTATATGLSIGTYNVLVTDANGCTISATYNITQPTPLVLTKTKTNVSCKNGINGTATVVASGGVAPYAYLWSNGGTTAQIIGLAAGTYTVTVTDFNGCTKTTSVVLTQPATGIVGLYSVTKPTCFGSSNGAIDVTVSGGTAPYTYLWSNGITTQDLNGITAGNYSLTITDSKGCVLLVLVVVVQPPSLAVSFNKTNVSCAGGNNGKATASVTGGISPYTYLWSNSKTTASITGLAAGVYTVTATDTKGCTKSASVTIIQPAALICNAIVVNNVSCFGGGNGKASVSATGGTGPYVYLWNTTPSKTTALVSNLHAGTYSVIITDSKGCTSSCAVTITQPTAILLTMNTSAALCNGSSDGVATVTATGGTGPYSYLWNNLAASTTSSVSGLSAGTYVVTVTDANGCTKTKSAVISQPTSISATYSKVNLLCNGSSTGSITVVAAGGTPSYNYTLNPGNISNTTGLFSGVGAGTYSVTITDAHNCTYVVNGIIIMSPTALSMGPVTATSIVCYGTNTASATAGLVSGGVAPYTYLWNTIPAQVTATATGLGAGIYIVTVTDANGCTITNSATINQPDQLVLNIINVVNANCNSASTGSAQASATGGTGQYSYLWSDGQTTSVAGNLTPGQYVVTVTDASGCSVSNTVTIIQPGVLILNITTLDVVCNGTNTGSITIVPSGGTAPFTYIVGTDTNSTGIFTGLAPGSYDVTVIDAGGCSASSNEIVSEPSAMIYTFNSKNVTCNGGNNGSARIQVLGGVPPYSYNWSTGSVIDSIAGVAAGVYSVTVTDASGCSFTATKLISQPAPIVISQTQVNVTCFGQSTGQAAATVSGGTSPYFYHWSNGQLTSSISGLTAGAYTLTVTDFKGCTSTAVFNITQNPQIVLTPSQSPVLCNGGTSTIGVSASGGSGSYTYLWSNNSTINVASVAVSAGFYNVVVTDAGGCAAISFFNVTQPTPLIYGSSVVNVGCNGGSNGQINVTSSGGTSPYGYILGTDTNNTGHFTGLSAGVYTVTIFDSHGCTNSVVKSISEPPVLQIAMSSSPLTCGLNNGVLEVLINGGTGPFTYLWSTGATTAIISSLPAGTYTVTVNDYNGCGPLTSSATVVNSTPVSCSIVKTDVSCNAYQNGSATVTANGGQGGYSYVWNSSPIQTSAVATGLPAGTYSVTVTDIAGCSSVCIVTIDEPAPLFYAAIPNSINCNGANNGSAALTVIGGTIPYSYLWSNGQTTQTATGLTAGTYNFTITDANGCSVSGATTITQAPLMSCNTNTFPASCGLPNGSALVNVFNGTAPYSYVWSNGQNTATATNLVAGVYSVVVTDANGCTTVCTAIVQQASSMVYVLTPNHPLCNGGLGSVSISGLSGGLPPYTYLWNNGSTQANSGSVVAGSYTVTITDASGCTMSQSASLINPPALVVSISSVNVSCNGGANGSAVSVASGGSGSSYSYLWSTGDAVQVLNNLVSGTYTVTATDINGCTATASVVISQPAVLDTLSSSSTTALCGTSVGTASVNPIGGTALYSYSWITVPVQTTQTATGLSAGIWYVTITDSKGCALTVGVNVASSTSFGLSLNSPVYAGGFNIRCNGGSDGAINLTVSGTGPFTYLWSNGSTAEDQFNLTAGAYTVTVSNGTCTSSANTTLTQSPTLSILMSQTNITCNGGINGTATASVSGGAAPYSYSWSTSPSQTNATATGLVAGVYTVIVSDANGCTLSAQATITQPLNGLSLIYSLVNPTCYGSTNGSVDLTVTGGTAPYTYLWIDGATIEDRTNIGAGNHTVTVTDANGCIVSVCAVLTQPDQIVISINSSNPGCNGGSTGSASASATGGTQPYSYMWNNGATTSSVSGLIPGTYTITVTDINGCTSSATKSIIVAPGITVTTTKTDVTAYGGNDGTATANVSGGTAPYVYSWNTVPVQTGSVATGLTAGSYTVVVSDASGCTNTSIVVINQPNYFCNPITRPWRTETITSWLIAPNGVPTQAGTYLNNHFGIAFPSGVVVGGGCLGGKTVSLSSATAVRNFLTGQPNTTSSSLAANYTNPLSVTVPNKLAAQLVALTLNVQFDIADANFAPVTSVLLKDASISGLTGGLTIFNGMTVAQFVSQANMKLAGCSGTLPSTTHANWASAAELINQAYVGGSTINGGLLSCPGGNNKVNPVAGGSAELNMQLYPNPTDGMVNIKFDALDNSHVSIRVIDLTGRMIWEKEESAFAGTNERQYDMRDLSKGVYLVEVRIDNMKQTVRVVLQ